jgi:hypothetical protein
MSLKILQCVFALTSAAMVACDGTTLNVLDGPGACLNASSTSGKAALAADAFVDSFGIKAVGMPLDSSIMKERLSQLGVRHMILSYMVDRVNAKALADSLGMKGLIFIEDINDALPALTFFGPTATAITWRNIEPVDATWGEKLRARQKQMFEAIKGNSATRGVDVVGPNAESDEQIAAAGNLSAWVDYGSMLPWRTEVWRAPPGIRAQTDLARHVPVFGNLPMIVPQNGYDTSAAKGVSEAVQAKYLVRTFLEHFRFGVKRTFIADLFDQGPMDPAMTSEGIGIIHSDGIPKPAFAALSRTMALLSDQGPAFTPGRLAFTISNASGDVHQLLLQKRNGLFYVALWREVESMDEDVNEAVTVDLDGSAKSLTVFNPVSASAPVAQGSGSRITLNVSDALTVLVVDLKCN